MKKCVKNCADCTEQKKASNGRICHDYWVAQYEKMYKAQATANGKNGALQAKVNIAMAKLKDCKAESENIESPILVLSRAFSNAYPFIIEHSSRLRKKRTIQDLWNLLMTKILYRSQNNDHRHRYLRISKRDPGRVRDQSREDLRHGK